jgi:hypothetical protein
MIVLTANICLDGIGGSVFEDQVDHFSVDKVRETAVKKACMGLQIAPFRV